MRVDVFDFDLPEDRIALTPAQPRDSARMLIVRPGESAPIRDAAVSELPAQLRDGDVLVLNNTRVIAAALSGRRVRGDAVARIDFNLATPLSNDRWQAFARPAKRIAVGERIQFGHGGAVCLAGTLDATVVAKDEGGLVTLAFDLAGPDLDAAIAAVGTTPLPPYIASRRPPLPQDAADYQTVYAERDGAVAAPTAGLHFTPALLDRLSASGVGQAYVTLHVGAGTFLPVKATDTADHRMHAEWGEITPDTAAALNAARAQGGRLVAVGTTSLRLLESAAGPDGRIRPFQGETDIFITPGYRFKAVDVLLTNFHLPRSTLFMLVCAFAGRDVMQAAYSHAIAADYRFYSFGDACLLHRAPWPASG